MLKKVFGVHSASYEASIERKLGVPLSIALKVLANHKNLRQVACVNNVIAKGFGCASGDNTCLCKQQDFVFGVRDCAAQSCTADESTKANDYVAGLCATATRDPSASTPPPSTPATQQSTPSTAPSSTTQPPPPATTAQASEAGSLIPSAPPSSAPLEATSKPITEVAQATQPPAITPTTLAAVLDNYDVIYANFPWDSAVTICFGPGRWA
ncbi:CFEM domain-containing protein [Colletotrichum graminicola M1.001]|uniref:CFEM domain-containing protein n=1 Tax=Colletotrichum graminicola (strain M1.001 / M2 / FGSC 10212) TaxID=645133 RepID=E3QT57_COLGM|nr:CFEM domain-containing protein [Colletotrichum graminicola M1.001]EFQ34045.1 CFEM domain-containing protein [Colletotrichum graminicola M1.001]